MRPKVRSTLSHFDALGGIWTLFVSALAHCPFTFASTFHLLQLLFLLSLFSVFVCAFSNWFCLNKCQNILKNFKNATFYVDCFLYWVNLILFPIQYFILSRDKL